MIKIRVRLTPNCLADDYSGPLQTKYTLIVTKRSSEALDDFSRSSVTSDRQRCKKVADWNGMDW